MKDNNNPELMSGRNSAVREATTPFTGQIAEFIHEKMPRVTPDHVSIAGTVGVIGANIYAALNPNASMIKKIIIGAVHGLFSATDGIDGKLANLKGDIRSKEQKDRGVLLDVACDKLQEITTPIAHAAVASQEDRWIGFFAANAAAATAVRPALARGQAEENRVLVEEGGKSVKQFFGTRVGRGIINSVAIGLPRLGGLPVQALGDSFVTYENMKVSRERLKAAGDTSKIIHREDLDERVEAGEVDEDQRDKLEAEFAMASQKGDLLKKINLVGTAAAASVAIAVPMMNLRR